MLIDDSRLKPDANNLTLVRLVLASAVIVTHCYWLVTGIAGADPLSGWLGVPLSVYAVDGFFFLSGFLVYPSLIRRGRVGDFLLARLARLWPALATSVVATVAIGAAVSEAAPAAYWRGETGRFLLGNLSFVQSAYHLTGVRCGDTLCNVNGSLWTLPWEARCYIGLALLLVAGLAGRRMMTRLVLPASVIFAVVWDLPGISTGAERIVGPGAVYYLANIDRLWTLFVLGCAASLYRHRIPLSWTVLALLFAADLAAHRIGVGLHVRAVFVGYAVLCFGFLTARTRAVSARWPDYSYGMYIYAFPVMMAIAAWWPTRNHLALALANFAATLPLAALSWHWIEAPVLERMRRRGPPGRIQVETSPCPPEFALDCNHSARYPDASSLDGKKTL